MTSARPHPSQHRAPSTLPLVVYTARDLEDADRERLMLGSSNQFLTKGHINPEELERRVLVARHSSQSTNTGDTL
jgi:DNA-binding response OmpR family regulator